MEAVARAEVVAPKIRLEKLLLLADQQVASSAASVLEECACEVTAVTGVDAALAHLAESRPRMVLINPENLADPRSAFDALKVAVAHQGAPLVALIRPGTHVEVLEACYLGGADDCIMQPLSANELRPRLRSLDTTLAPPKLRPLSGQRVVLVGDQNPCSLRVASCLENSGFHVFLTKPEEVQCLEKLVSPGNPTLVLLLGGSLPLFLRVRKHIADAALQGTARVVLVLSANELMGLQHQGGEEAWFIEDRLDTTAIVKRVNDHFRRTSADLRVHERVPFFCPVEVREIGVADAQWSTCFSYDLSPGGIFLRTLVPPRVRACVEFRIRFTVSGEVLDGTGVVSWANSFSQRSAWTYPFGAGVQFLGMSPKRLGQLRALCEEISQLSRPPPGGELH